MFLFALSSDIFMCKVFLFSFDYFFYLGFICLARLFAHFYEAISSLSAANNKETPLCSEMLLAESAIFVPPSPVASARL